MEVITSPLPSLVGNVPATNQICLTIHLYPTAIWLLLLQEELGGGDGVVPSYYDLADVTSLLTFAYALS